MPIKLINVNIMSQLTSRGLDNTSSAFVSDIYIYIYVVSDSLFVTNFGGLILRKL